MYSGASKGGYICGRYAFFDIKNLKLRFGAASVPEGLEPRYNAAPGRQLPIVTKNSPLTVKLMKWGLVPVWAKPDFQLINIRSETLKQKTTFKESLRQRRCLIPANGYYEWQKTAAGKQPYYFQPSKEGEIWGLAGLYEDSGFAIITTEANPVAARVHNRMPVIIEPGDEAAWLDNEAGEAVWLKLMAPWPADKMKMTAVGAKVNRAANDGPELVKPL